MTIKHVNSYRILSDDADVIVCPTNAGGVMGAGLAKAFREQIPGLFTKYRKHCQVYDPKAMVPFIYFVDGEPTIYCLHTKCKYWMDSTLDIIRDGVSRLLDWCQAHQIRSVALPALGCGRGGLTFEEVMPLLDELLSESSIEFRLYHRQL